MTTYAKHRSTSDNETAKLDPKMTILFQLGILCAVTVVYMFIFVAVPKLAQVF